MGMAGRQNEILRILCRRRHETISHLAAELGVSERTIRRDIEELSLTAPIYTRPGRYDGGVYVMDGYTMDRMYFKRSEADVIRGIVSAAERDGVCVIGNAELLILKEMLASYSKPVVQ